MPSRCRDGLDRGKDSEVTQHAMAWERRSRGSAYYTRSRRVGGRVVREYLGGGLIGTVAAAADAEQRAVRFQQARAWVTLRSQLRAAEDVTDQFCAAAETLTRGAIMLSGYHQHHRGEWRKRRV
jgi:hypothetical protein